MPSLEAHAAHAPPLLSRSDGRGLFLTILDVSTVPFSFLNILLHILDFYGGVAIFGIVWADQGFGKTKEEETILMSSVMR